MHFLAVSYLMYGAIMSNIKFPCEEIASWQNSQWGVKINSEILCRDFWNYVRRSSRWLAYEHRLHIHGFP